MKPPHEPHLDAGPIDLSESERDMHELFGALRDSVVRITEGFTERVSRAVEVDHAERLRSPSARAVVGSLLAQLANLLTPGGPGDAEPE